MSFSPQPEPEPPPELATKDLGAQEGKYAEKEKEEDEEGHDRLNRVDQRAEQVLKGSPVPGARIRLVIRGTGCFHWPKNPRKIVAFSYYEYVLGVVHCIL